MVSLLSRALFVVPETSNICGFFDQIFLIILISTGRLLTEDPDQRLGAVGASEVLLCHV